MKIRGNTVISRNRLDKNNTIYMITKIIRHETSYVNIVQKIKQSHFLINERQTIYNW